MLRKVLSVFIFLLLCSGYIFAQGPQVVAQGTPEIYTVTIKKVELYNSTTSSWVTVGEGDMSFNIAEAETAGEKVGDYISNKSIPEGVYTHIRLTVSRIMTIKGRAEGAGVTYYTTSISYSPQSIVGLETAKASTDPSDYDVTSILTPIEQDPNDPTPPQVIGDYFIDTNELPQPLEIKKGVRRKIRVSFDLANTLEIFKDTDPGQTLFVVPREPRSSISLID